MAKKKPEKISHIQDAIEVLTERQEKVLANSTTIELIEIDKVKELLINNDILMHNRISYSKEKLYELASNISKIAEENSGIMGTGLLNPVMLRNINGRLERIHGENRIKALKINNQKFVPAIVLENVSDELARFMRSSENLNREDLNAYDETLSILEHIQLACNFDSIESVKKFINKVKNYKAAKTTLNENEIILYEQVSKIFSKIGRFDIITFVDRLSILKLQEPIKQALVDEYINYSSAKIINSKLSSPKDINKIIDMLKNSSMSKTELTKYINNMIQSKGNIQINQPFMTIDKIKNINKIVNKRKYAKLSNSDKIFVDEKIESINTLLEEISSKVGE